MILLSIYIIGYLISVVILREKLPESIGVGGDSGEDKFLSMFLALIVSAAWPLLLAVLIVSKIYEFAKKALVKNMNKNETQEEK